MFDSITLSTLPSHPEAVAGYVGGNWPDFSPEIVAFPKAHHLSIAVTATEDAECLDIENGDALPSQASAWVKRQSARGVKRPALYASLSVMPQVLAQLASDGINRGQVRIWTAHYTYKPHVCTKVCGFGFDSVADATQWTDHAFSRNLDQSLCLDGFFFEAIPIPVANKLHYDWFDAHQRVIVCGQSELSLVKHYDRLRALQTPTVHPHRLELHFVRFALNQLAKRVNRVAHTQQRLNAKPSWNVDHRGWRYQQLIHRAQGVRFT